MRAQEGMVWMVTLKCAEKDIQIDMPVFGHFFKGLQELKGRLAENLNVRKSKIRIVERWQEVIKE